MIQAVLFLALVAAVVYVVVRRVQGPGGDGHNGGLHLRRPVAPDDDPGFLRQLDDMLWHERRRRHRGESASGDHGGTRAPGAHDGHDEQGSPDETGPDEPGPDVARADDASPGETGKGEAGAA